MPKHALGRQDALAGNPAMPGTLQNFLTIAFKPSIGDGVDQLELVTAIELDSTLFSRALALCPDSLSGLADWHDTLTCPMLQALALSVAEDEWQGEQSEAAIYASFLAAEIARRLGDIDVTECRLTALLTYASESDVQAVIEKLPERTRETLRFVSEPLDDLMGMPGLVRVVAVARSIAVNRLADATGPAPNLIRLDTDELQDAIDAVSARVADVMPVDCPADFLAPMLAEANRTNALYRAIMKSAANSSFDELVRLAGGFLLGGVRCCHLCPEGSSLIARHEDAEVSIGIDWHESRFAAAMKRQAATGLRRSEVSLLVEKQVFDWLDTEELIMVPLSHEAGMIVVVPGEGTRPGASALAAFADATGDLYQSHYANAGKPSIHLDEMNRQVREITHEVNNPLAIIQNYLATLRLKLGADAPVKELDAISRELVRVSTIIQKYRRIGDAEDTLLLAVANLNEIVSELVLLASAGKDGIEIQTCLDDEIPAMEFAVDATKQVVLNILKNAVEAVAETEGAQIAVETNGSVNMGGRAYIEVTITDNGPGMSTEQRLSLFETNTTTKGEGRGLGMGIVQALMDRMSGLIACRPGSAGCGTCFQILLPLDKP
jgi:signal transduction histidine kinase